jgi:hypothetical protein
MMKQMTYVDDLYVDDRLKIKNITFTRDGMDVFCN